VARHSPLFYHHLHRAAEFVVFHTEEIESLRQGSVSDTLPLLAGCQLSNRKEKDYDWLLKKIA
ncbi:MAG: hypothetical protein IJ456_01070, partial [Bacteroides sp.]|nr:hypothetical protein [Bacteroides sp.]